MNEKMENAVRSVLKLDPDYSLERTDAAIQVLKGKSLAGMRQVEKLDYAVSRQQAAASLLVGVHRVDQLVREGKLKRIPPNAKRASGISAASVDAYQHGLDLAEMGVRQ